MADARRLNGASTWTRGAVMPAVFAVAIAAAALAGAGVLLAQPGALPGSGGISREAAIGLGAIAALAWGGIAIAILGEGYLATLWLAGAYVPGLVAVLTVLAYLVLPAGPARLDALPIGLVGGAMTWVVTAVPLGGLVTARRAQPRTYGELLQRATQLRVRLQGLGGAEAIVDEAEAGDHGPAAAAASLPAEARTALAEARRQLVLIDHDLVGPGSAGAYRWATASGYVGVMRALHRAEEALVEVEPVETVVADALHDDLSVSGSTLQDAARLRAIIREGVAGLSSGAASRLFPGLTAATKDAPSLSPAQARAVLREVRHALNDFRDDVKDGLVRARTRLVWAVVFAAITTYLLLGLALLEQVDPKYLIAAATFYLVGAIVGLFSRLRIEGRSSSAVEDYGLYQARLVHTPVISGLAAVAGVFLVAAAPALLSPGTASGGADLATVFDLGMNQQGLIVAAVFGLAPDVLTRGLAGQAVGMEQALQKSEAATSGSGSPDASTAAGGSPA